MNQSILGGVCLVLKHSRIHGAQQAPNKENTAAGDTEYDSHAYTDYMTIDYYRPLHLITEYAFSALNVLLHGEVPAVQ